MRLWWDMHPLFVVAALSVLVGGLRWLESYKDGIKVTIISGRCAYDQGFGPDNWAAPRPGEPTRRVWALSMGGNGQTYSWDGSRGGRYRWIPD